jgi:hypothetical protein
MKLFSFAEIFCRGLMMILGIKDSNTFRDFIKHWYFIRENL